jgi:ATP diphosphatase
MSHLERLLGIMARLRDPQGGCPWDLAQDWRSIAPHTIEEAYEVADAVQRGEPAAVRDELGDLLFQVVFQARIAEEQRHFDFDAVAGAIADKLERRHPHVFGKAKVANAAEQSRAWESYKAEERRTRGHGAGALDGVALGLPALSRAMKLGSRAARVGFDWTDLDGVLDKIEEELRELRAAQAGHDADAIRAEMGDLLFSLAQSARHLGVDAEGALRDANAKFERRFRHMEATLAAQGRDAAQAGAEELEALWLQAKRELG